MNDKKTKKATNKSVIKKETETKVIKTKAETKKSKSALVEDIESIEDIVTAPKVVAEKPKKATAKVAKEKLAKTTTAKTKVTTAKVVTADSLIDDFDIEGVDSSKPPVKLTPLKTPAKLFDLAEETAENAVKNESETIELSPIFKALAEPRLPSLPSENRAYLQMQSPNRIFFYWSIKGNPYETLYKGLGNRAENYQLIVKLVNLTNNSEEFHPVETSGSWWFNVQSNSSYRAEVGFLAPNRPFIRLVFSNTLETPRSNPSPNRAFTTFTVSANQFAEVLEAAGFTQDAFDVYLAGDDANFADNATQKAYEKISGEEKVDFTGISLNELRYILFTLASGVSLVTLRDRVSSEVFSFLATLANESPESLNAEKIILALEEFFGINFAEEEIDEEYFSGAVYGASLVNFPKGVRKHKSRYAPNKWELAPLSSSNLK